MGRQNIIVKPKQLFQNVVLKLFSLFLNPMDRYNLIHIFIKNPLPWKYVSFKYLF